MELSLNKAERDRERSLNDQKALVNENLQLKKLIKSILVQVERFSVGSIDTEVQKL